jgi:hypothetical protein
MAKRYVCQKSVRYEWRGYERTRSATAGNADARLARQSPPFRYHRTGLQSVLVKLSFRLAKVIGAKGLIVIGRLCVDETVSHPEINGLRPAPSYQTEQGCAMLQR